jgi:ATP-dependent protease ClpP protease subunit
MPNWNEVLSEMAALPPKNEQGESNLDVVRRKYLKKVYDANGNRNVIAYYSGWLQKQNTNDVAVNDKDISGLMLNIHKLDKSKGLDLILHTPGGDLAATESLVTYLKKIFGNDIRAIVPQLSMSAGTVIALSCKEIIMGKQSSLGPIDPQMGGMPCEAVIAEFERARAEIIANTSNAYLWELILSKYYPTFLNSCQNAIDMANQLTKQWLKENMCEGDAKKSKRICEHFSSHTKSKTHARHLSIDTCKSIGVKIVDLEANQDLQDAVLTTHHAFMHSFSNSNALKIIENHNGIAYVEIIPFQQQR